MVAALESGIPTLERSEMLGVVTAHYRDSIAVSGTHGKPLQPVMLTQLFIQAEKILLLSLEESSRLSEAMAVQAKSDIMICEACEYVDTF